MTIACSRAVEEVLRGSGPDDGSSRIMMIENGARFLDSVPGAGQRLEARKKFNIPFEAFVALHIGGMRPGPFANRSLQGAPKGHDTLLKAFAKIFDSGDRSLLLLVGDGTLKPAVQSLARELGIEGGVRFLGELGDARAALCAADVFCFPSRWEGMPNALLEAAGAGIPVVASDIPEHAQLDGTGTWSLKPVDDIQAFADGLCEVRKDPELHRARARGLVRGLKDRFSMDLCARRYLEAYRAVE